MLWPGAMCSWGFRELPRVCKRAGHAGVILEGNRAALWGVHCNPSSNFGAAFLGYLRGPRLVGEELSPSLWAPRL